MKEHHEEEEEVNIGQEMVCVCVGGGLNIKMAKSENRFYKTDREPGWSLKTRKDTSFKEKSLVNGAKYRTNKINNWCYLGAF